VLRLFSRSEHVSGVVERETVVSVVVKFVVSRGPKLELMETREGFSCRRNNTSRLTNTTTLPPPLQPTDDDRGSALKHLQTMGMEALLAGPGRRCPRASAAGVDRQPVDGMVGPITRGCLRSRCCPPKLLLAISTHHRSKMTRRSLRVCVRAGN
jgi:hypothetical protein